MRNVSCEGGNLAHFSNLTFLPRRRRLRNFKYKEEVFRALVCASKYETAMKG